jgi:hypothetical protein
VGPGPTMGFGEILADGVLAVRVVECAHGEPPRPRPGRFPILNQIRVGGQDSAAGRRSPAASETARSNRAHATQRRNRAHASPLPAGDASP